MTTRFSIVKRCLMLIIFCVLFSVSTTAQTIWYRATQYAQASVYNGNYTWSDWKTSSVKLKIDWSNDVVVIYSQKVQKYTVISVSERLHSDNKGGKEVKFRVVDQDGDRGSLRFRLDPYDTMQIYIDFSNIAWVYNIVRI